MNESENIFSAILSFHWYLPELVRYLFRKSSFSSHVPLLVAESSEPTAERNTRHLTYFNLTYRSPRCQYLLLGSSYLWWTLLANTLLNPLPPIERQFCFLINLLINDFGLNFLYLEFTTILFKIETSVIFLPWFDCLQIRRLAKFFMAPLSNHKFFMLRFRPEVW